MLARRLVSATSPSPEAATTINQFIVAGAIDELRLHVVPVVVDVGDVRLWDGVGPQRWSSTSVRSTPEVTHLVYTRAERRTPGAEQVR